MALCRTAAAPPVSPTEEGQSRTRPHILSLQLSNQNRKQKACHGLRHCSTSRQSYTCWVVGFAMGLTWHPLPNICAESALGKRGQVGNEHGPVGSKHAGRAINGHSAWIAKGLIVGYLR